MAYTHFAQIHPAAFPWPPMHRQFATAEPARQTLLGAMRYGSNRLRTSGEKHGGPGPEPGPAIFGKMQQET
jgi:hypothetical protein